MQRSMCTRHCCSPAGASGAAVAVPIQRYQATSSRLAPPAAAAAASAARCISSSVVPLTSVLPFSISSSRSIRSTTRVFSAFEEGGGGGDSSQQQWYDGGEGGSRDFDRGSRGRGSRGRGGRSSGGRGGRGGRSSYRDRDGGDSYGNSRSYGRDRDGDGDSYGSRDSYRGSGRGGYNSRDRGSRGSYNSQPDWLCGECGVSNFGSRSSCRSCEAPKPAGADAGAGAGDDTSYIARGDGGSWADRGERGERPAPERRAGDWDCEACGSHNYARRVKCFNCGEKAPEAVLEAHAARAATYERSESDWTCPECGDVNFARRSVCRACDAPRPEGVGGGDSYESRGYESRGSRGRDSGYGRRDDSYGQQRERGPDWNCSCGELNYGFRTECRRCGASKP